jgi:hypothetical protein
MMGYGPMRPASPALEKIVDRICVLASQSAKPSAAYRKLAICSRESSDQELQIEGGRRFRGGDFLSPLRECKDVVAFVLSLGMGFDRLQQDFRASQEALEGYVLNTAGWWGVEHLTAQLKQHLATELAAESLELTRRLGPGYIQHLPSGSVMWPLEDQVVLFSCFEDSDCDSLPASLIEGTHTMQPQMSRSGLYGARPM